LRPAASETVAAVAAVAAASVKWFSRCGHFTRIGQITEGGRPLLREGGPISYEAGLLDLSSPTLSAVRT